MMTVGSLFSGIGGFELGLERTKGFKTVWQCEKDEFCLKVLEKHWPDVKRFTDIHEMKEDIPYVDVICGGFPCQPVSCAGKRKGKEDERWLWPEFCRVVCCVRPEWVLIENVPGLLSADSGRLFAGILRDLSSSGYDAEWNIVSAAFVGAPHLRKRVFIIAHSNQFDGHDGRYGTSEVCRERGQEAIISGSKDDVADADQIRRRGRAGMFWQGRGRESQDGGAIPDPQGKRLEGGPPARHEIKSEGMRFLSTGQGEQAGADQWSVEPDVGRVANGVPGRVDRLRALGNAIVPQCSEFVGRCILEAL